MKRPKIPLLILAGSDQRSGPVPGQMAAAEMLSGFKGVLPLPGGHCLLAELIARVRASGRFADPVVIGPRPLYQNLVDCEIVDVAGSLVNTLEGVRDLVTSRFPADAPVAVSACDILPTADELCQLLEADFDPVSACHFWWQFIAAAPEELGASAWKPQYRIREHVQSQRLTVYPGHLVIFRPQAVRLDLLIRLLTLAYRHRNRPFHQRVLPMLFRGVGTLLGQDLRNLLAGQLPTLAGSIPWHVVCAYREMQTDTLTVDSLERHMGRVLLHRAYRREERPLVVALSRIFAFAKDIDCQAELDDVLQRAADR